MLCRQTARIDCTCPLRLKYTIGRSEDAALPASSRCWLSQRIPLVLPRQGCKLKRDLVLVAVADEKQRSACGIDWLVQNAPKLHAT